MRAYLAVHILGAFAFDSNGTLLGYRFFAKKPEEIAAKLEDKGLLAEEKDLLQWLVDKGYKEVITDKKVAFKGLSIITQSEHIGKRALNEKYRAMAVQLKWSSSQGELNELLGKIQIARTKASLRTEKRDRILVHVSNLSQEMDRQLNMFSERLREWYGLHFPELGKLLPSSEQYAQAIASGGQRGSLKGFEAIATGSAGMPFSPKDAAVVQAFAQTLADLYQRKQELQAYIAETSKEIMPNTTAIAGDQLAARLLAAAGSMERLSRMPSSTVQLLGAEKALFRHLKGEGKSPKYGVLHAHPLVQNAVPEKQGKVARLIAAKLSLAMKTDYFTKEDRGEQMRKDLEAAVAKL